MVKAAFMMCVKIIVVCHNEHHVKVLKALLRTWVVAELQRGECKFAPPDLLQRLDEAKPARLKMHETQKKRTGEELESPASKRQAMAQSVEAMLNNLSSPPPKAKAGSGVGKSPPPPKAAKASEPKAETAEATAGAAKAGASPAKAGTAEAQAGSAEAKAGTPVTAPAENLQALLSSWG